MRCEINIPLSQHAADLVDAQPKACWKNAILAQLRFPQATYIEGWIVIPEGVALEHGWLELDDEIIEPTFAERLGNESEHSTYFSGVAYSFQEANDALAKRDGELPLVYGDGRWGYDTPEYVLASCDAWDYVFTLDHVRAEAGFIEKIEEMREMYQKRL